MATTDPAKYQKVLDRRGGAHKFGEVSSPKRRRKPNLDLAEKIVDGYCLKDEPEGPQKP